MTPAPQLTSCALMVPAGVVAQAASPERGDGQSDAIQWGTHP